MTVKNLIDLWSLPDRTQERQQITLRLNYDLYAKLHALKDVYPNRTVNDMINDILKTSLDEIIDALPIRNLSESEAFEEGFMDDYGHPIAGGIRTGPRIYFDQAYRQILNKKSDETSVEEVA